jgi:hypothetical protein
VKQLKGEELLQYRSVQNWISSIEKSAKNRNKKLSKNGKGIRLGRMWEYTLEGKLNPDELLAEAKKDINLTGKRLEDYFYARKKVTSHNTALTALSFIRGFYSHNDVTFPRSITLPKKVEAKVASKDEKTSFYDFNEETEEFVFKNGYLQHFIQNLSFRDQTVALCLLSSGADAKDVLSLNVGFVKDINGKIANVKRFFWHGTRAKTREPFRTFFSEEATHFLKRYVEQERANAKDDEPLFVQQSKTDYKRRNPLTKEVETISGSTRLDNYALSKNFRIAAKKMGFTNEGQLSPFRPKRFRHLFRTACSIAEVDVGYARAMMGHASDVSAGYLEKDQAIFKKVYVKVEPFVTVFGINKNLLNEMEKKYNGLQTDFTKYSRKTLSLEEQVADLKEQLKSATELVYSFEPVLSTFSAIADTVEGQELIKKLHEAKAKQETVEAQEETNKQREEITKEHPIPKKAKSE